jgi:hypothetical protein
MRNHRGQGVLMTVLLLGMVMAFVIMFGAKRQTDVAVLVSRLDASQTAYEVLAAATKRVQSIYANEAGCDPTSLNLRLSRLVALPVAASISTLNFGASVAYAVAQNNETGAQLSAIERANLCTGLNSPAVGCRQLAINLENLVYVVTVGNVVAGDNGGVITDCPRDAVFRVSVAINGSVFSQWASLINVCTLTSCGTGVDSYDKVAPATAGIAVTVGAPTTTACATLPSRSYGSLTSAATTTINVDDLRWARRYLETGGGSVGETSYMVGASAAALLVPPTNGACTPAQTVQCFGRACVPAFDLNRDKTNNEADLAILELYLRGFLMSLPVSLLN